MNALAEDISKSSGDINSLVQRLSAQQEGELQRREHDLNIRETALADKKRIQADRKLQLEIRKRKLNTELEEIGHLEREAKNEFESEKSEIKLQIDKKEIESQAE